MTFPMTCILGALLVLLRGTIAVSCNAKDIPAPELFGVQVLDVLAQEHRGYTDFAEWGSFPPMFGEKEPLDFCNVTIKYTHPGLNDTVHVYIWLPLEGWNGNFLGQGGGCLAAGEIEGLTEPVLAKYASAITDAGHTIFGNPTDVIYSSRTWALTSPGNVNLVLLQDFAYRALDDMTHLAKAVVHSFYGREARYAYWHGCSTGGRQGFVQAQRFPKNYDGILSVAPAINWVSFIIAEHWPHVVMKEMGYYPAPCELDALTASAIEACDELDGVKDGVISAPGLCKFDAQSAVGKKYDCDGERRRVTKEGAELATAIWQGPVKDGRPLWFGLTHETRLVGKPPDFSGLAMTSCDAKNRNCKSVTFRVSTDWIRHFIVKDTNYDPSGMTKDEFFSTLHASRQEYYSLMDSADPDLSAFKAAGGKIIHWHGLADQLIFPNGSSSYYERVKQIVPDVESFYRYFEVPGVAHCIRGPGVYPKTALSALVDWVEKGIIPEQLDGESIPESPGEKVRTRPICPYPLVAAFKGGDPDIAESFECADSFDKFSRIRRDEL